MSQFLTGKALDEKLTDIIWNAKKELIILSPFIHLDEYCKEIFKKIKNNPDLELVVVFGKNENQTHKSLKPADLDFFKQFHNVVIIYCANLHAKFYANESEGLLTSLNLLDKSMTGNIEYGIALNNSTLNIDKLYKETYEYTNEVIKTNTCVFVKRPVYKKANLGFSKKFVESVVVYDETHKLYNNQYFKPKKYNDFEYEFFESDVKVTREEFSSKQQEEKLYKTVKQDRYNTTPVEGYCIRTGIKIPYNPKKPMSYDAFLVWAEYENYYFTENYCHRTGKYSNGKTCMANPELI
jgi:hypothetical protein